MLLRFCDCGNLLRSVVTSIKYHICSKCEKKFDFEKGDTMIRAPATKPSNAEINEHIIQHMHKIPLMPIIEKECPQCKKKRVKYAILNNTTWYRCTDLQCANLFQ